MELQNLTVESRETTGKGPARQQRAKGRVPGVVYGGGQDPLSIFVNLRDFERLLRGRGGQHAVLQLEVSAKPELNSPALLKAVQRERIKGHILHADFLRIRLDERIETVVKLELTGQPAGVVDGGVLEHQLRELEVECLALEIPERIVVDVSGLQINETIHVSELNIPEGMVVLSDPDRPVASVIVPRALTETAAAPAEGEEGAAGEEKKEGDDKAKDNKDKDK